MSHHDQGTKVPYGTTGHELQGATAEPAQVDYKKLLIHTLARVLESESVFFIGEHYGYPKEFSDDEKIAIEAAMDVARKMVF